MKLIIRIQLLIFEKYFVDVVDKIGLI